MTATTTTTDSPVSREDLERFLAQIIEAAGNDGLTDDDLEAAADEFTEMHLHAAAISMWHARMLRLEWRNGEMLWCLPGATR